MTEEVQSGLVPVGSSRAGNYDQTHRLLRARLRYSVRVVRVRAGSKRKFAVWVNLMAPVGQEADSYGADEAPESARSLHRRSPWVAEDLLLRRVLPVVVRLDSLLPPPRWAVASAQVLD